MKHQLKHLTEFKEILKSYKVSELSKDMLSKIQFVTLTAPTSVGRNTIIRELLKTNKYREIISDTTRQPRINDGKLERNGVEYWFKSEMQMIDDLRAGNYIEAAIIHNQQVSGVNVSEIEKTYKTEKIAITDIETQGVHSYLGAKPDTITLFVLPPSINEWMRRIKHRGSMGRAEFKRRLESACREFDDALSYNEYIFIINDDFHQAVGEIDRLVNERRADVAKQQAGRVLASQLKKAAENLFSTLD
jgi:guanylate kinase